MNISWLLEWHDTMVEIREFYDQYYLVTNPSFFNPDDPEPTRALMWLARDQYLDVCVDLIRNLLWHNLERRYYHE